MKGENQTVVWLLGTILTCCFSVESAAESVQCQQARAQLSSLDQTIRSLERDAEVMLIRLTSVESTLFWDAMWLASCRPVLDDLMIVSAETNTECKDIHDEYNQLNLRLDLLREQYERKLAAVNGERNTRDQLQKTVDRCNESGSPDGCTASRIGAVAGAWKWYGGDTTVVTLGGDGLAVSKHKDGRQLNEGTWQCASDGIVIEWQRWGLEFTDYLAITEDGRKLDGHNDRQKQVWGTR